MNWSKMKVLLGELIRPIGISHAQPTASAPDLRSLISTDSRILPTFAVLIENTLLKKPANPAKSFGLLKCYPRGFSPESLVEIVPDVLAIHNFCSGARLILENHQYRVFTEKTKC